MAMSNRVRGGALFVFVFVVAARADAPQADQAQAILDDYTQSLDWTEQFTLSATRIAEDTRAAFENQGPLSRRSIEKYIIRKDGKRLYIQSAMKTTIGGKVAEGGNYTFEQIVGTGEDFRIQDSATHPAQF